jgi:hypothetical protein
MKMERLTDDELVIVAKKIAEFGGLNLGNFLLSSRNHARICKFLLFFGLYPQITWTDLMMIMFLRVKPIFST